MAKHELRLLLGRDGVMTARHEHEQRRDHLDGLRPVDFREPLSTLADDAPPGAPYAATLMSDRAACTCIQSRSRVRPSDTQSSASHVSHHALYSARATLGESGGSSCLLHRNRLRSGSQSMAQA